jgi:hypothetical protein
MALAKPTTNSDRFKYAFSNAHPFANRCCLSNPLSPDVEVFDPFWVYCSSRNHDAKPAIIR